MAALVLKPSISLPSQNTIRLLSLKLEALASYFLDGQEQSSQQQSELWPAGMH